MSVPENKRGQGDLTVLTKARELKNYTLHICVNEKNFPKRYRWCVTNNIVLEVSDICRLIISANAVKVDNLNDKERRLERLKQAYELTEVLLEDIDTAYSFFHLASDRVEYWTTLVMRVQLLLRSWMQSDNTRYKNIR